MKHGLKFALGAFILGFTSYAFAQNVTIPSVNLGLKSTSNPKEIVSAIQIILLLTVLTLAPAILILMTSFTRIIVVFSFLRQALGTQQMPPNQLLVGLSLFLTFFIMQPVLEKVNVTALKPYMEGQINQEQAIDNALVPMRKFMFSQTRPSDLSLFLKLSNVKSPKNSRRCTNYGFNSFFCYFRT